ncbi:MAG: FAD-dependent oxidoreductase, partial [Alphaproteobacteria bacterium]|nr:FAD-dependent oxidoreductase [Alphaproteobacteria bacterium]
LLQEELGYIEGGSLTLVQALTKAIAERGGKLRLNAPVLRIEVNNSRAVGVIAGGEFFPADAVISTVPTPYVSKLVPDMPAEERARYDAIENIGVVCVVFRLKRSITPHFWVNIIDTRFEIPGIIEFSNLRPTGDTVVYIPYYMPTSHPKFAQSDAVFRAESFSYLKLLNPELTDEDVVAFAAGRLRHAQPVCPPGFAAMLPPVETSIRGLQIADTCFYYPEDRGIAESVRLGREMAERVP